jgi:hypothetical protein
MPSRSVQVGAKTRTMSPVAERPPQTGRYGYPSESATRLAS